MPIPQIQDALDSERGKSWFSAADMSPAYHQGYMAEESQHLGIMELIHLFTI